MSRVLHRFLLHLLWLTGLALPVRAATLEEANAHFAAGDFAKAAAAYEELIASSGPSATRLYNLGNARFKLKEHGPAILAYERAALLAPRDPDIRANLKMARQAAAAYEEPPAHSWWESVLHACSLHEWSWITMGSGVLIGVVVLVGGIAGFSRRWIKRVTITGMILGVIAGSLGGFALWHRQNETKLGIVTAADATLRLSPFADATSAGTPGIGRTIHLGERSNGWIYGTVPGTSLRGWLPDKDAPALMVAGAEFGSTSSRSLP
jgi:hypothetical protein